MDDLALKLLFDAIREVKGGALTSADVARINAALAGKSVGIETSQRGLDLMHEFEGYRETTYPDPGPTGKPVTGGWGTTKDADGNPFKLGVAYPKHYWEALFKRDLARFEAAVRTLCPVTTQGQFDALVSFAYNVGEGSLKDSTLRRKHNEGDYAGAKAEFARWNKAGGVTLPGLVRRRLAEAELYAS